MPWAQGSFKIPLTTLVLSMTALPIVGRQPKPTFPRLRLDLSPFLTQPVKAQNPSKGELSHGVVEKDVHERVQAGCGAAARTGDFDWRGWWGARDESQRAAPLAARDSPGSRQRVSGSGKAALGR